MYTNNQRDFFPILFNALTNPHSTLVSKSTWYVFVTFLIHHCDQCNHHSPDECDLKQHNLNVIDKNRGGGGYARLVIFCSPLNFINIYVKMLWLVVVCVILGAIVKVI